MSKDLMIPNPNDSSKESDGLLIACVLDGNGGASDIDWQAVESWTPDNGPLWVHLDQKSPRALKWLESQEWLEAVAFEALTASETRPRTIRMRQGVLTIVRGINTNPEADPEDMVAMRMWCDGQRLITIRQRRLMTPVDVLDQLKERNEGPTTAAQLFERLISRITERMSETIGAYEDQLDSIEMDLEMGSATQTRKQILELRRSTVLLRRYLAPQREVLSSLVSDPPKWMEDGSRSRLRETADRMLRYVEELDAARERAIVIQDDITTQLAESTNKTLYVLSIVSAIFLPLGFLTGLLGINVGGVPGVDNSLAFWIFCVLLIVVVALQLLIMRKLRWI